MGRLSSQRRMVQVVGDGVWLPDVATREDYIQRVCQSLGFDAAHVDLDTGNNKANALASPAGGYGQASMPRHELTDPRRSDPRVQEHRHRQEFRGGEPHVTERRMTEAEQMRPPHAVVSDAEG